MCTSPHRVALLFGALLSLTLAGCGNMKKDEGSQELSAALPTPAEEPEVDWMKVSDEEWRERLSPEAYRIAREGGTERANGPAYDKWKEEGAGQYACAGCKSVLFTSETKFDARCGWPAFYDAHAPDTVVLVEDLKLGMKRVEVKCATCDAHLGHVFKGEGFDTPTDERYCINGAVLDFIPAKDVK